MLWVISIFEAGVRRRPLCSRFGSRTLNASTMLCTSGCSGSDERPARHAVVVYDPGSSDRRNVLARRALPRLRHEPWVSPPKRWPPPARFGRHAGNSGYAACVAPRMVNFQHHDREKRRITVLTKKGAVGQIAGLRWQVCQIAGISGDKFELRQTGISANPGTRGEGRSK